MASSVFGFYRPAYNNTWQAPMLLAENAWDTIAEVNIYQTGSGVTANRVAVASYGRD